MTNLPNLKLNLLFDDRVGIVADVAVTLADNGLNIVSMEVERRKEMADVYIDAERDATARKDATVIAALEQIPNLKRIRVIKTLPREKRENRFKVVLDNVSDGILSIDQHGTVTTINQKARLILNCEDQAVLGQNVQTLNLPDMAILTCLDRKKFTNVKRNIINAKGRYRFLATGKPIVDSSGRVLGAVEIIKDMKEISALAGAVTQTNEITFSDFRGKSPAIHEAIAFAQRIAPTDSIVSIRGESGTGKELFARAIHTESGRSGPFIPINCAALPESLLESELFGYVGGAFTGARKEGKPGLFEIARDGTIFLDEIAEMPPGPQAKILRLIQERTVRRIGGAQEIPINARIITATNRNLEQMVHAKNFRQDLYYRINVLPIHIPPLKERLVDLEVLVEHFLLQISVKQNKNLQVLSEAGMQKLTRHQWPGNVRELKNVIARAAILADNDRIEEDCIMFSHEIGQRLNQTQSSSVIELKGDPLPVMVGRFEKQIVTAALREAKSARQAARLLGISHTALNRKRRKYEIGMETN